MKYQENEAQETRNRWLTVGVSVVSLVVLGLFGTQISAFLNSNNQGINNKSSIGSGFSLQLGNSSQAAGDPACYVVADRPGDDNAYYYDLSLDPSDPNWETPVGTDSTGVFNIEASEFDPVSGTLYAWDAADFGTIDLATGVFVSAGTSPGNVCGYQAGNYVCFDGSNGFALGMNSGNYDMDGMAYNPISDKWYASVRIKDGSATESWGDWLVEYDENGVIVDDAFGYDALGNPIGFLEIGWFTGIDGFDLHDIDDLAFDPTNGQLYGVANRSGGSVTNMVAIDITDGSVTDLGNITTAQDCNNDGAGPDVLSDVEGLSIDLQGRIWAVTGSSGGATCGTSMYEWTGALDGSPITATYHALLSETDQESITCSVYEPVSVGDTIFIDNDGSGTQDAGDSGIPGVVLYITNAAGDTLGTATTDANGNYLFDGLLPDAEGYTVIVGEENFEAGGALEGLAPTNDPDTGPGASDNQATSDGLPNGGDEDLDLDFGFIAPVTIGDTIWFDTDADGTQNNGEAGIENVVLYVVDVNGDTLGTATTDENGNYLFDNLPPSADGYTVIVGEENFEAGGALEGLAGTNDPDSGPGAGDNQGTSDPLPNVGDEDLSLDFGFTTEVSVGDTIWFDTSGDGEMNGSEEGIPGVVLYITNAAGDTLGTATTDENGNYLFDGLPPDAEGYTVLVGEENFAPGGVLEGLHSTNDPDTGPGAGDMAGSTGELTDPGDSNMDMDFGFNDVALPVELIGLTAESTEDRGIQVRWATATETNNAGFSVEYSKRGAPYKEAGFVTGQGNSDIESSYEYMIENLESGIYLIRLKQIDLDGQIAYSNEVEASLAVPTGYSLEPAYPNPFNPTSNISFTVSESKPVALRMYDAAGRMVKLLYQGTAQANNSLQVKIDAANLPAGTYIVRLEGENISASQKVVLLK